MKNHTWASSLQRGKNAYNLDISQIDGAKSGFTDEAQLTLASTMTLEGHQFILVTAYAKGQYSQNHVRDAISVCQYLHDHYHEVILYKKDEDIADYWLLQSFQFRYSYKVPQTISLIVPKNLSKNDLEVQIDTDGYLIAPMEEGEQIGTLSVYDHNQCLYSYDMILTDRLSSTMLERVAYYGIIVIMISGVIIVIIFMKRKVNHK